MVQWETRSPSRFVCNVLCTLQINIVTWLQSFCLQRDYTAAFITSLYQELWIFTLQYRDICHCVIMGLVCFSHLAMYLIIHEFCVSPCSHAQTTGRTLTDCDTLFPLFDIALLMTHYYFKQNYNQFKSFVAGLGTWIHHIGLNEFSN